MSGRVLVAEDEEEIGKLLKIILRRAGIEADHASNGREALDLLRVRPYAVIVCDLNMPVMSGYDLIESLSEIKPSPAVIVLTAGLPSAGRPLDPTVVTMIMRKPFDVDTFAAVVGELSRARAEVQAPREEAEGEVIPFRPENRH